MKHHYLALAIAVSGASVPFSAMASPWIGTQDKQLHYDVQTLVEWGHLNLAVTTYPIPWKGIAEELTQIDPTQLSFRPRQAYQRLLHYLRLHQRQQSRQFLVLQGATDEVRLRSFDDGVEQTGKLTFTQEFYYDRLSAQVSVNYVAGGETNLDNSFVAWQLGDWNLRVGSLDQFWGPAQSSSLILSNNTRPIKSVALSRSQATASEHPWLSWIGPWYLTTQMGQLESDRAVPNAKLFYSRANARPVKGLEIGLSWSLMWGGDGQPQDIETFIDAITFQSLCLRDDGICTDAQLSKRGNHIAGIDISYTATMLSRPVTVYLQRVGEDSAGGINITDNANLFGISTYLDKAKVFLETSDTNVNCDGNTTNRLDCYYEHGTYTDGYRMYGRAIGSTFDSDAKQLTLGANYRFESGSVIEVYIRSAELNKDASRPSPLLNESASEDVLELSGFYQTSIGNWLLKGGASIARRDFGDVEDTDSLAYIKAQYAF